MFLRIPTSYDKQNCERRVLLKILRKTIENAHFPYVIHFFNEKKFPTNRRFLLFVVTLARI